MPSLLVVEDGTQVAGANAYVTLAEFKAYIGTIPLPTGADADYERGIILATRYLDGKYRHQLQGQRVRPAIQPLEFPRVGVRLVEGQLYYYGVAPSFYDSQYSGFLSITVIPQEWKNATCELALRALTAPLAPDIAPGDRVKRKKIDVLETEYVTGNFQTSYPVVEQLISRFLKSSSDAVRG